MACVGGGIDVNWLVLAAACCVRGLVSGGGRGRVVWGRHCWWWRGQGWVETQIFHLLFHKLTFFEFDSQMVFLTNNEKFIEEKDMVLLGIGTQTHVVHVGLHFCTPRNQLLY